MRVDAKAEFSDAQAITVDAISTNVMERDGLGLSPNALQQLGLMGCFLVITIGTALTDGDTINFQLVSDSTANLATSPTVHWSSGAISTTPLNAGVVVAVVPLPWGNYEDFIGLKFDVGTGPLAAGTVNAFLTNDPYTWRAFAHGSDSVNDYPAT